MIFEIKLLEEEPAQIFPLIGADRERRALAREAFQRCDSARVWPAFPRYIRLVVDEATIDHFDQLDVCAATLLAAKTRRSAPS